MRLDETEFSVEETPSGCVVKGVLRLPSPDAYAPTFASIRARLAGDAGCTIDLSQVTFMNSSGIRALAELVLLAKGHSAPLRLVGSGAVTWQRKTLRSLGQLYSGLEVELGR